MNIERSALVPFSAVQMYGLVKDVASYPEFLRWCTEAEVHEQSETLQVASLGMRVAGVEQKFSTRNRLQAGRRISMALEEGPFQNLSGEWQFRDLKYEGSKVCLALAFDFKPGLLSVPFELGFKAVADHMVSEFVTRAESLFDNTVKQQD